MLLSPSGERDLVDLTVAGFGATVTGCAGRDAGGGVHVDAAVEVAPGPGGGSSGSVGSSIALQLGSSDFPIALRPEPHSSYVVKLVAPL